MATQHINQKGITYFFKRLTLLYAAVLLGAVPMVVDAGDIFLGTEEVGSFSHFTGRAICRNLNRSAAELNCQVASAEDGIDNLTNLQQGSLDMALVDSGMLFDAIHKTGDFAFLGIRYDNLGSLLPLYQQPFLLIARRDSNIETLEQLKGKRINAGAPRSREHQALDLILKAKGWTKQDFSVVQELPAALAQDTMAFCQGAIEAMLHIGVHPDAALQQLMNLCDAVPVDMDDLDINGLVDRLPALSPIRIPPATYPGLEKPVAVFGTTILLVASGSLDEETTLAILAALEKNQANLKNIHPALGQFSVKRADGPDIGLSLHPGAAAYFSAQGK